MFLLVTSEITKIHEVQKFQSKEIEQIDLMVFILKEREREWHEVLSVHGGTSFLLG
jgi:hypothetical protein